MKPLVIDLFCGLGGWSEGFLAEGYECRGYDIEAHDYGTGGYPGTLILRDVRSIHGSDFKDAAVIVASPPCQAYSYRAMPWKRAKALPPPDNTLFNECFRIQREASEAAGHYIPLIVENVRGAQKWVGRAQWNYGSFYLWGDVPALMPLTFKATKIPNQGIAQRHPQGISPQWRAKKYGPEIDGRSFQSVAVEELHADRDGQGIKQHGSGHIWYRTGNGALSSKSSKRKAASAMIAKIPFPLAQHIARTFKP
jgi:hypothetical protein